MINDTIKIHDKFQFELKLSYILDITKRFTKYDIETYMFIPNNLDINRSTYLKDDFYNDLKNYIRFKTPVVNLRDLPEHFIFSKLEEIFKEAERSGIRSNLDFKILNKFEYHIKMFAMIFRSAIFQQVNFISKINDYEEINKMLNEYVNKISIIIKKFRKFREIINVPNINKEFIQIFQFVDEYISNFTEVSTFTLLEKIKKKKIKNLNDIKQALINLITSELKL